MVWYFIKKLHKFIISLNTARVLDSLVVRISACHVEGPGSIPGRGEYILDFLSWISRIFFANFQGFFSCQNLLQIWKGVLYTYKQN